MTTNQAKTSAPQAKPQGSKLTATESTAAIVAMIGKVATSYGNAQALAQTAALAILTHAKAFGDCSKAPALVRALPARERNSLIGWFGIYSPIRIRMGRATRNGSMSEDKVRMAAADEQPSTANKWGYKPFDIVAATDNPWFGDPAGENPIPRPLDTLADFENVILKRLTNAKAAAQAGERFMPTQKDNVVNFVDHMLKAAEDFNRAHPKLTAEVQANPANANGNTGEGNTAPKTARPRVAASA